MSVVVKGGLTAAVLGVGCTGTYFLMSGAGYMPSYVTIESDTNYNSKIGKDYKHILVDTNKNKDWWEWSFSRLPKNKQGESTDFGEGKITTAFHETTTTALNKVCDTVYKKSESEVSFDSGSDAKHKLGRDILKYCSPLGERPTTIDGHASETYTGSNHIGNTNKTDLASIKSPKNHHFWSAMQKYLMTSKPSDNYFKEINEQKSIKTLCQEAYGKEPETNTSSTSKPTAADAKKYCFLSKLTSS